MFGSGSDARDVRADNLFGGNLIDRKLFDLSVRKAYLIVNE